MENDQKIDEGWVTLRRLHNDPRTMLGRLTMASFIEFLLAGIPEWFSMKYFCDGNFGSFGNASVQVRNPEKPSELFLGHLDTPVI